MHPTLVGVVSFPMNLQIPFKYATTGHPANAPGPLSSGRPLHSRIPLWLVRDLLRVDAHVDSLPLVRAWSNQGGKNKALSDVIQAIYEATSKFNIALSLVYVPSGDNLADTPSRALSESDCMLSPRVWREVERCWGPHSIDLMALDSNAHRGSHCFRLRHFTPWPSTDSAVVNIFTQTLHPSDNAYVFPPLALVGIVLRLSSSQPCPFTFVTPHPHPGRYWWPSISGRSTDSVRLGALGDLDVLLFPTPNGSFLTKPLP